LIKALSSQPRNLQRSLPMLKRLIAFALTP
jgi:hypothetical protein